MSSTLLDTDKDEESRLGGQMSFLEHLDELRRRLIRSAIYVFVALVLCWFVSDRIYNFLSVPVRRARVGAQPRRRDDSAQLFRPVGRRALVGRDGRARRRRRGRRDKRFVAKFQVSSSKFKVKSLHSDLEL